MADFLKKYFLYFLFFYHLFFAFIGWKLLVFDGGDSFDYWFIGSNLKNDQWMNYLKPGVGIVKLLTYPLVKFLHLPFWFGFLLFSIFSFFGFLNLWKVLIKISNKNFKYLLISAFLLLLPNAHFWTSLIGKEALLFTPIAIISNRIYFERFSSKLLWLSILFVGLIRPHFAFVLLFFLWIYILFNRSVKVKFKLNISLLFGVFSLLFYFALVSITRTRASFVYRITQYYEAYSTQLKETTAHVPLEEYSIPYKIFTFYFRPLFYDKINFLYLVASIENFIILILFIISVLLTFKIAFFEKKISLNFSVFVLFFLFFIAFVYVFAYTNFGLILRTKTMVFPFFYIEFLHVLKKGKIKFLMKRD